MALFLWCSVAWACVGSGSPVSGSAQKEHTAHRTTNWIAQVSPLYGQTVSQDSEQRIGYRLIEGVKPDSVILTIGERRIGALDTTGYLYRVGAKHPTGRVLYKVTVYCDSLLESRTGEFTVLSAKAPQRYGHKVLRVYPHREEAYTQGLLWHNGELFESTGLQGESSLRRVELSSGRPIVTTLLDGEYFGEGLALLKGKLYQLTWQNNKAFVYALDTFEKVGEFEYGGEGWGLTTDGKYLYMSDGSEKIYVLDPETFQRVRTLEVYTDQSKVSYINEMEWIRGEIWANVYMTDTVIRIDPTTGAVTGAVDMSGLLEDADRTPQTDVLNGIAYDARTGRIFVTGKRWPKLFEIEVLAR
ncbi:MAG: glutaminyl-peptide cyclotransferase [Alistipes sp.]|nr:glutaminyl-peptide cyclotransferase [Alistipes sp.]